MFRKRTKKQAINHFRYNHGWKETKENGWICPVCANRGLGEKIIIGGVDNPELLKDGGKTE